MFTKEDLESMELYFKEMDGRRKYFENGAISQVLAFFGLPYTRNNASPAIEDFLEYDNIVIFMPEDNYRSIDFSKLSIPKKLRFQIGLYSDEWRVVGFNNYMEPKLEVSFTPGKN